jgi:hypothetical protein
MPVAAVDNVVMTPVIYGTSTTTHASSVETALEWPQISGGGSLKTNSREGSFLERIK